MRIPYPEVEAILILLVAVATFAPLANKIKIFYPILLALGGLVLGSAPGLHARYLVRVAGGRHNDRAGRR
jgi:hypothetical protein